MLAVWLVLEVALRLAPLLPDKSLVRYRQVPGDESQAPLPDQATHTLLGVGVATNSHGLRDPERSLRANPGQRRVVLLGDSVVWGFGLASEETPSRRVEAHLAQADATQDWEVWTLGQPATTQLNHAARFARLSPEIEPDAVFVMVLFNDLLAGPTRFRVTASGLLASPHRTAPYPDALRPLLDRSAVFHLTMMGYYAREKRNEPAGHDFQRENAPDLLRGLQRTVQVARAGEIPMAVVVMPGRYEPPGAYVWLLDILGEWTAGEGVPLLDLADDLGAPLRDELSLPGDSTHPNAVGADLMAARLAAETLTLLGPPE